MRQTSLAASVLIAALSGATPSDAQEFVFESGVFPLGPSPSGASISDRFYPFHRFEVTATVLTGEIGGFMRAGSNEPGVIFGGIVALSGPDDFPDSTDLSTPDLLGTTLIEIDEPSEDYAAVLSLELEPGWYGLVFGWGDFGAVGPNPSGSLRAGFVDTDPAQGKYSISPFFDSILPSENEPDPLHFRMFVTLPEPGAGGSLLAAGGALALLGRRRSQRPARGPGTGGGFTPFGWS